MFSPVFWVIIGMGAVTYIPRMLPLVALRTDKIPPFIKGVLQNVPYAVLGALILPGIFVIETGNIRALNLDGLLFGLIGGGVAFIVAYLEFNLIYVVLSAIVALSIYIGFVQ